MGSTTTDDPLDDVDLAPREPCCAETAGGPFELWAHWEADARLLRTAVTMARACPAGPEGRVVCAGLARAAWDQLGYRFAGLVRHRTRPLPCCDCPWRAKRRLEPPGAGTGRARPAARQPL
jgi:hypothetical protein